MEILITSIHNPTVKGAIKLRQRRHRERNQRFLIEGYRELLRALEGEQPIETLFFSPELFLGTHEESLIQKFVAKGATPLRCTEKVFHALSYRDRPDGLLAVGLTQSRSLADFSPAETPFYVVAEAIEKPGNLGTILRSSDAVGVDGVIVCDRCTDLHNPNVVRASVGTLFTLPVVEAEGEESLAWLRARGVSIVAATPSAKQEYSATNLEGPVAIVVGTEQYGLSKRWMESADIKVKIPMKGHADSLNVAMATTLLLYEVLRQRNT